MIGNSASQAGLGWVTLFPATKGKGKASGWDKWLALACSRNDPRSQEQQRKAQQQHSIPAWRTPALNTGTAK